MRISFLTGTPLNLVQGSGTFASIATLARAVRQQGVEVEILAPGLRLPVFTAQRLWFNEQLRSRRWDRSDIIVGFDMDGYRVAGQTGKPHVASIKGVIADEMRFERGMTRLTMSIQARAEALHVRGADLVITTSRYAAGRIQQLYGLADTPAIVPESIDLAFWRGLFEHNPAEPDPGRFTILTVCRFYPRKRLHVLLGAAARLRAEVNGLQVRVVGGGPESERLRSLWHKKRLENTVVWLGDLPQDELAREYNGCDLFCLPSVQEGFGIVFLEAMLAGKPIVAARAAAVPEVVEHGVLVEPDSEEALAEGILNLYHDRALRDELIAAGQQAVIQYGAQEVAGDFLSLIRGLL